MLEGDDLDVALVKLVGVATEVVGAANVGAERQAKAGEARFRLSA